MAELDADPGDDRARRGSLRALHRRSARGGRSRPGDPWLRGRDRDQDLRRPFRGGVLTARSAPAGPRAQTPRQEEQDQLAPWGASVHQRKSCSCIGARLFETRGARSDKPMFVARGWKGQGYISIQLFRPARLARVRRSGRREDNNRKRDSCPGVRRMHRPATPILTRRALVAGLRAIAAMAPVYGRPRRQ